MDSKKARASTSLTQNIAKRKKAEDDLRTCDETFQLFVSSVEDYAIFMLDTEGRVVSWNDGAERIKGYTSQEIIGQHFSVLYTEIDVLSGRPALQLEKAVREGSCEAEGWRLRKDGSRFYASVVITAVRDKTGKLRGFGKVTRDVTERKRAGDEVRELNRQLEYRNSELARAEAKFRGVLESAPDAMVVSNREGEIVLVNSQAEKAFGYPRDEMLGHPVGMLMPERFRVSFAGYGNLFFLEPAAQAMAAPLEIYGLHRDGQEFPVEINLSPLETEEGTVVTCAIRDISRRKAAEDDARKLGGHLLKMQDVERRRIARELHDNAGQIIAALTINLELIKSAAHLGPREEKILTESDSMLQNLGTDLRTISHLLHPPLLDEIGLPCALKEYVDGFARRSGIATKLELASDFGRLTSDSEIALFRIVQECLTNIHRHSGSPEATVRLMRSFDEITLEVNDKGCGMRLEASGPRVLGVGLRGMQERVLQLGGKLDIQSGIGTTVTTTLPISTALAPAISDIE